MRRTRNSSGGNSDEHFEHAHEENGNEENMPTPLRKASGKRKPRPLSGDFDYDAINRPLAKSPRSKTVSFFSICLRNLLVWANFKIGFKTITMISITEKKFSVLK